ncbi:MAG: hypothetical protein U0Q16_31045 [Bryobacteraceae bacterium]
MFVASALLAASLTAQTLTLDSGAVRMNWELNGGSLSSMRLKEGGENPFTWEDKSAPPTARMRGHFLCLDRWGAPSDSEKAAGMPFHGEASKVAWKQRGSSTTDADMSAQLPMARLSIRRTVKLQGESALVSETVTNDAPLGRVYNMVQHPTIAPPFLDESVLVDSNARQGFMQSSPMPNPEQPSVVWPQALRDGAPVNMRHLTNDPEPNVVSYVVDEAWGWTTAVNPGQGVLLGYVWRTSEYPWFNAWRHVENGKPAARGLEFGTTGLHQPYPILIRKGRIFGRPIFAFLDGAETQTREYQVFLLKVPSGHQGMASMKAAGGDFIFTGRDGKELRIRSLFAAR